MHFREGPLQFENRIMPRIITRSSICMYSILLAGTGVWKICGFTSIKIDYSDYTNSLISRINEVYVCFNKISLFIYNHFCFAAITLVTV